MRALANNVCVLLISALALADAQAQSRVRIFSVELGSSVDSLPDDEWVNPACGTNGGPPSLQLRDFNEFRRCPVEADTGLREVWFIYDDEWEYIGRAHRDPVEIGRYSANVFYGQPIITSLMLDEDGTVRGYRVATDTRAPNETRKEAYVLFAIFKGLFGDAPWECSTMPPTERERPFEGVFMRQDCTAVAGERLLKASGRRLLKPGQDVRDVPRMLDQASGDFESSARLEVYDLSAVKDEPCCRALLSPSDPHPEGSP